MLYVLDCSCCGCEDVLPEVPHPASVSANTKRNTQRALRELPPRPNQNSGSGEARASTNPVGAGTHMLLLVVLTVMVVLCGALPDTVAGAKLQPHPVGKPEQANDSAALNPFSGVTFRVKDPGVLFAIVSVPLDRVNP